MKEQNKILPIIDLEDMERDELKAYVKEHIPFYRYACLDGHTDEQLQAVINRHWSREKLHELNGK